MSTRGDRGQSGEEYIVLTDGQQSAVMSRQKALGCGQRDGVQGKDVEVRRLRKDRTSVLVAAWKDGVKTK